MKDVKDVTKALKEELGFISDTVSRVETLVNKIKPNKAECLCVEKRFDGIEEEWHNECKSTLEDSYAKIEIEDGMIYFELKDEVVLYGLDVKKLLGFIERSKAKVPLKERVVYKVKGTTTHEINNQAQAEYFEKWQKDMKKSMKEMCERINERVDCREKEEAK